MLEYFLVALGLTVGLNLVLFVPAFLLKTDKLTDFSYGLTFFLTIVYLFVQSTAQMIHWVFLVLVTLWAVRISTYLLVRVIKTGKDKRFDGIRESFWSFLSFWFLQGLSVWLILFSTTSIMSLDSPKTYWPVVVLGCLIALGGLIIETISDYQKFKFKNNPKNKGLWIESGLWKYSRHPNYFGEILFWIGLYVIATSTGSLLVSAIGAVSPLYIFIIIRFFSGIPTLENKYDERYKDNTKYQKYKESTNLLVLGPKNT